ncbi:AraC family transcriptional regulator [Cohnella pontilimi]|uniref:AraC family transcriptional regulator n=1 Tax=Cohnella pontilimi TaxID=2564100 RepID=UPI001B8021B2|nr:AraC family transcriptional regulator [Cohnella pontilimi]
MDGLERMRNALEFMERNMDQPLDVEEIAKAAYSSPFHFQRMFHMLTGVTVAEYTRKRKLTLAANELATSSAKVIDVALKYGYESPEAFSKAFRKLHGITPSQARHPGAFLKAFPRISFQLVLTGDQEFIYRIEDKPAFEVLGKSVKLICGDESYSRQSFWSDCERDGTLRKLVAAEPYPGLMGITMDVREDFTYMIAREAAGTALMEGLTLRTIPACTWAIFTSVGPLPEAIQSVIRRIFQEWFPATGYEHSGGPEIEVYLPGDSKAEDYTCEVWIPIVKQAES